MSKDGSVANRLMWLSEPFAKGSLHANDILQLATCSTRYGFETHALEIALRRQLSEQGVSFERLSIDSVLPI